MAERDTPELAPLEQDKRRAMRWPEYGEPETIPPPSPGSPSDVVTTGFYADIYNALEFRIPMSLHITSAQSSSTHHRLNGGREYPGAIPLYATRSNAAKAMRLELTRAVSEGLAEIDDIIEKEQAEGCEC